MYMEQLDRITIGGETLYTIPAAAREWGVGNQRARDIVHQRGIGQMLGRTIVLTQSEIDACRERAPGRPTVLT